MTKFWPFTYCNANWKAGWIRLGTKGPGIAFRWEPTGWRYFSERNGYVRYIAIGALVISLISKRK